MHSGTDAVTWWDRSVNRSQLLALTSPRSGCTLRMPFWSWTEVQVHVFVPLPVAATVYWIVQGHLVAGLDGHPPYLERGKKESRARVDGRAFCSGTRA
jgi:hypothetical protein